MGDGAVSLGAPRGGAGLWVGSVKRSVLDVISLKSPSAVQMEISRRQVDNESGAQETSLP